MAQCSHLEWIPQDQNQLSNISMIITITKLESLMAVSTRKSFFGPSEVLLIYGIREVGKGSWKIKKLESFKLASLKLESFCFSLKEPSEVRKNRAKLKRMERCWKEPSKVEKAFSNFSCTFQLQSELFNFGAYFPTSFLPISYRTLQL